MHRREDDEADAQDCEITDEGEGVTEVVEPILDRGEITLRLREQVSEGTKLIWLICREAHPMLKTPGKIM